MAMRELTTPPTGASPEASSKTAGKSYMLSAEEREAIEMRNVDWLRQELTARGVIKPEAKG